ncbi:hypothetical protein GcM1_234043 [Golovinomyces cichoracearum]|uniref:Uncharacterized protein n=1 Tax=Golovinomyces cichoracearum TaxID=62708 RepID=A0A420ILB2_9PEZI|nr:hypothetical protein GcM1_234043 [Golovinomyces cichoracearum]
MLEALTAMNSQVYDIFFCRLESKMRPVGIYIYYVIIYVFADDLASTIHDEATVSVSTDRQQIEFASLKQIYVSSLTIGDLPISIRFDAATA